MTDSTSTIALVLIPFLAGNACLILHLQPKLCVIARPLARSTLVFCLGIWSLNRPVVGDPDPKLFAMGLVPWLLLAHLLVTFVKQAESEDDRGLRYDALLYSASFLIAICLTNNLGFLILFGESLALSTWMTATGTSRQHLVKRSIATFVLISLGTGLILSETRTADLGKIESQTTPVVDESDAGRFAEPEPKSSLSLRAGILFVVFGYGWRIGFFPFIAVPESTDTLGGFQRRLSLVTAGVLVPAILMPRLRGAETVGVMLLFTLSVPTLLRETLRSGWRLAVGQRWRDWWTASAALMWISLGLELLQVSRELSLGLWLPAGLLAVRLELLSSLGSFIVLTAMTHELTAQGYPLTTRESFRGLLRTNSICAMVLMLGIMNWVGVPLLAGFAPRWGVLASLLEVSSSGLPGEIYFALMAVLVLSCEMLITFLGLLMVQSVCDACPVSRPAGRVSIWRTSTFAAGLLAIVLAGWI